MPPQQDRSVASRWRPELDNSKSGGRNGQLSIHRAFVSFGFEGMKNSFTCFAPSSSSRFKEDGFLGAKLQRSRLKAAASFSFEGMRNSFSCFASASTSEFREAGFLDARLQRSEFNEVVSFLEN
ncbi:hypothetical protein A3Q36_17395 [Geobacillus stearothermophilus]|nr:hypothetical protein A3Q36_17395 [Geobacillus stearothermophilus]